MPEDGKVQIKVTMHRDREMPAVLPLACCMKDDFDSDSDPGILRCRPESEPFFRLAKTTKQAILVLSLMESDAARRKKGSSKPDRVFRHSLVLSWHEPRGTVRVILSVFKTEI